MRLYRKILNSLKIIKKLTNIKKCSQVCVTVLSTIYQTLDTFGKGLNFCVSKHDIRCPRISSTESMASEGDFPSRISAATAIAKSPQL